MPITARLIFTQPGCSTSSPMGSMGFFLTKHKISQLCRWGQKNNGDKECRNIFRHESQVGIMRGLQDNVSGDGWNKNPEMLKRIPQCSVILFICFSCMFFLLSSYPSLDLKAEKSEGEKQTLEETGHFNLPVAQGTTHQLSYCMFGTNVINKSRDASTFSLQNQLVSSKA